GHSLLDLINNLLDLAKIESGKMLLNIEAFDFNDVITDIQSSLKPLIEKKALKLRIHTQDKLPPMRADLFKMKQVLMNLLGNAIKFTENEGDIDIFVEHHQETGELCHNIFSQQKLTDEIRLHSAFLVRVRDTGVGIRPEDLPHIFDLFRQADSSFTRKHEGTGLGLALAKQIVTLHSGLINVNSQIGRGTEFRILIPQL
ncbi:MAG TPA: ATP-binding protein, partial [bacterium]|nr:ATP-binding protein [bacterium]